MPPLFVPYLAYVHDPQSQRVVIEFVQLIQFFLQFLIQLWRVWRRQLLWLWSQRQVVVLGAVAMTLAAPPAPPHFIDAAAGDQEGGGPQHDAGSYHGVLQFTDRIDDIWHESGARGRDFYIEQARPLRLRRNKCGVS
jgi:hypothetical protein